MIHNSMNTNVKILENTNLVSLYAPLITKFKMENNQPI